MMMPGPGQRQQTEDEKRQIEFQVKLNCSPINCDNEDDRRTKDIQWVWGCDGGRVNCVVNILHSQCQFVNILRKWNDPLISNDREYHSIKSPLCHFHFLIGFRNILFYTFPIHSVRFSFFF